MLNLIQHQDDVVSTVISRAVELDRRKLLFDLVEVAARLDADEKLAVTYRFPVNSANGQGEYETRQGALLDVAEEAKLLYVSYNDQIFWIKQDEVVSITPRDK